MPITFKSTEQHSLLNSNYVRGVQKEFRMPSEIYSVEMGKNKLNMKVNKTFSIFYSLRRTIITSVIIYQDMLEVLVFPPIWKKTFTTKSLTLSCMQESARLIIILQNATLYSTDFQMAGLTFSDKNVPVPWPSSSPNLLDFFFVYEKNIISVNGNFKICYNL